MDKIRLIDEQSLKKDLAAFDVGDEVKVHLKIPEGDKFRIHIFEGTVIAKRGTRMGQSFTVRRVTYGEGVERTFPLHSPIIEKIEVVRKGKVRRAKIYYLRKKVGKAIKLQELKSTGNS